MGFESIWLVMPRKDFQEIGHIPISMSRIKVTIARTVTSDIEADWGGFLLISRADGTARSDACRTYRNSEAATLQRQQSVCRVPLGSQ